MNNMLIDNSIRYLSGFLPNQLLPCSLHQSLLQQNFITSKLLFWVIVLSSRTVLFA